MRRLLATTTVAAALCGAALLDASPGGAASPPDVDEIALGTSRLEFNAELTWSNVVYEGQRRTQGLHQPTAVHLAPNSCASVTVSWFDDGDGATPAATMERDLGCTSITDPTSLYLLHMSRFNTEPVKAKVCVTSRPKVGIDRPQTACATAFPFIDRSQGI